MANDKTANGAQPYLHVMLRYAASPRWHVLQISDEPPRVSLSESVASYTDAHKLTARDHRPLRIAR